MDIIFPKNNSGYIGKSPAIYLYEPFETRKIQAVLLEHSEIHGIVVHLPSNEYRSKSGITRCYIFDTAVNEALYTFQPICQSYGHIVPDVHYHLSNKIPTLNNIDLIESIEQIYFKVIGSRFIANGAGKSGTSYLYNILSSLPGVKQKSNSHLISHDYLSLAEIPFSCIFHAHIPPTKEAFEYLYKFNYFNFFIYRDLRDQIVSEYFHKFRFDKKFINNNIREFTEKKMLTYEMILRWSTSIYASDWCIDWFNFDPESTLKYEDLLTAPHETLKKLFMNKKIPVHDELLSYIISENEFEIFSNGIAPGNNINSFFRNGKIGDWKNYLDDETNLKIKLKYKKYFSILNYDNLQEIITPIDHDKQELRLNYFEGKILTNKMGQIKSLNDDLQPLDIFCLDSDTKLDIIPSDMANNIITTPDGHLHLLFKKGTTLRLPEVYDTFKVYNLDIPVYLSELYGYNQKNFLDRSLNLFSRILNLPIDYHNSHFVHIGCGIAAEVLAAEYLSNNFYQYLGIDLCLDTIRWCDNFIGKRLSNIEFKHLDSFHELLNPLSRTLFEENKLQISNSSTDCVVISDLFKHLLVFEAIFLLKEVARILKKNGIAYIMFSVLSENLNNISKESRVNLLKYHSHENGMIILDHAYCRQHVIFFEDAIDDLIKLSGLNIRQKIFDQKIKCTLKDIDIYEVSYIIEKSAVQ